MGDGAGLGGLGGLGADLVETGRAVDRRSLRGWNGTTAWPPQLLQTAAWYSRLPTGPPVDAGSLRGSTAGGTPLWVVRQPLAGEELLLAR